MSLPFNIFDRFKQQIVELQAESDPAAVAQLQSTDVRVGDLNVIIQKVTG